MKLIDGASPRRFRPSRRLWAAGTIIIAITIAAGSLTAGLGVASAFADNSLPGYDKSAAALLTQRVLSFLGDIE